MNAAHSPQRILLVEDDTVVRHVYSKVLTRSGYRVDTAEDGEAGWQALDAVNCDPDGYDLLITDNDMPKVSGVELIEKLHSAHMTLPTIMVSRTVPKNPEWLELSAILSKPLSPYQLVQTVKDILHTDTRQTL
jgi:two-component system cell cycle sensor histidine kinase/response regulator CckA